MPRIVSEVRPTLSVSLSPDIYRRLKAEIGGHNVSAFVEKAIVKQLGEHNWELEREQKEFQQKLVAGYKRAAQSKTLRKEEKIWEEAIEDILN